MTKRRQYEGRATYVFGSDLVEKKAVIVSTVKRATAKPEDEAQYVNIVENLPVQTFRGGSWAQDVLGAHKTFEDADKAHEQIIGGKF
jgi:hypothetical protein